MVKTVTKGSGKYYLCLECNFAYRNEEIAEKCEAWCKKHHSCNLEITKRAVKI